MNIDSSTKPQPAFSDRHNLTDVATNQTEYRSVSRLAVCAFLLGLASPLALVHPLTWTIPWIGVLVALQAIRQISRPNSLVSGRPIALVGLVLSVLLSGWAPAKYFVERSLLTRQARQFADTWFHLVRDGTLQEAHRWMLPHYQRDPEFATQEFYEENVYLQEDLEDEFTSEPANRIAGQSDSTVRFLSLESIDGERHDQGIVLKYLLKSDSTDHEDVEFFVRIRREIADDVIHWQLSQVYQSG